MTASDSATAAHRFDSIPMAAPDAILGISEAFAADPRAEKMNLSVGVYKDASGVTPIMKCVKAAEQKILDTETSKGYLGIDGLPDYRNAVREMLLGDSIAAERVAVVQTPGGTGASVLRASF